MPQSYYYNGQQIDTFTDGASGSYGVLVSTFQHDSSPDVSLVQEAVARAGGTALLDARTRAKTITMTGSIEGTTQADFEQRLDAFKALFQNPQGLLKVTNYGTLDYRIATFEEGESWTRQYVNDASTDDAAFWDFTNYKIGRRGLILEAVTGTPKDAVLGGLTLDLSSFTDADTFKLWAYVPDTSKLTSIRLRLEVDGSNHYAKTWSSFTTGWNELTVLRSALTTTGSPTWSTLTTVRLTVTGSNAAPATVTFDDLRISTTAEARTFRATLAAPVELRRDHYHVNWCPFSLTFTVPDGTSVSDRTASVKVTTTTKPQRFLPRYLSGSGPQALQLTSVVGSSVPSEIQVADHLVDTFSCYEDTQSASEHGYWLAVSTFESTETWSAGSADTTNKKVGAQGRKLSPTASTTVTADRAVTANYSDLPNTERAKLWVYVDNATNFASIDVMFFTTAGVDYFTKNVTGLVTGWNLVSIQKKDFTTGGAPTWATITQLTVQATANGSGTCNVTFDDWRWEDALNCTGGNYTVSGSGTTWEIGRFGAYRSALAQLGASGAGYALLTNKPMADGEVIALCRAPSGGTVGIGARALNAAGAAPVLQGAALAVSSTTSNFTLYDGGSLLNMVTNAVVSVGFQDWAWIRLVCRGSLVQLFYRPVSSDTWTKVAEGTTRNTASGYWGLYASGLCQFAQVEVIDYATEQANTLRLLGGPFTTGSQEGMLHLDTGTLTAREGPLPGTVRGAFPVLKAGFNEGSILQPAGVVGTTRFRYADEDMTLAASFGDGTVTKIAVPVAVGSQTYVRRRGSALYLGKTTSATPAYDVVVRLETDTAGSPSGTLVDSNATVTLARGDVSTSFDGSATYNASWVPYELVWPADIPLTGSTVWVVVAPSSAEAGQYWAIAGKQPSGGLNEIKVYSGSWAALTSSGNPVSGYALLATDYPHATVSTPWYDVQAHRPSYL